MSGPSKKRKLAGGGGSGSAQAPAAHKPAAAAAALAPAPTDSDEAWPAIAARTGWTPADCLAHKLSVNKRRDAAGAVDALAAHLRVLRALGAHLVAQVEGATAGRDADAAAAAAAASDAELHLAELLARAEAAEGAVGEVTAARTAAEERAAAAETAAAAARADAEATVAEAEAAVKEGLAQADARAEATVGAAKAEAEAAVAAAKAEAEAATAAAATVADARVVEADRKAAGLEADLVSARQQREASEAALAATRASAAAVEGTATAATAQAEAASARAATAEAEAARLREAVADARAAAAEAGARADAGGAAAATAQAYAAGLQEVNVRQAADLAGAAEAAAVLNAEKAALALEGARLKGELVAAVSERDTAAAAAAAAREEAAAARGRLEAEAAAAGAALDRAATAGSTVSTGLADQLAVAQAAHRAAAALADARGADVEGLQARVVELEARLEAAAADLSAAEATRKAMHNTIAELRGNIRVFCRVRPGGGGGSTADTATPALREAGSGDTAGRALELTLQPSTSTTSAVPPTSHSFVFDRIFGPASSQEDVWAEVEPLVQSVVDGYKACVLAYGPTGTGKTHTMLGTPAAPGLVPRAIDRLFEATARTGWAWTITGRAVEVYNEEVRCLLGGVPPPGKKHSVSHVAEADGFTATTVAHAAEVDCADRAAVADLVARATAARAVGATAANAASSRSHAVILLALRGTCSSTGATVAGGLNLVDLAGSERLKRSCAEGDRLKETAAINKSLAALGDVIAALGGGGGGGGGSAGGGVGASSSSSSTISTHIPYRNSKLTWLLAPSLGGGSKVLMVVAASPVSAEAGETLCSLRFAAKVNATEVGTARRVVRQNSKG